MKRPVPATSPPRRHHWLHHRGTLWPGTLLLSLGIAIALGLFLPTVTIATPGAEAGSAALAARQGVLDIAQEMSQDNLRNQFGLVNLFIIFFVTLGPLKIIPAFVQLTQHAPTALKRQLAYRSTAVATVVVLLVVLIGRNMMAIWQIQLPALMIAGGILLSVVALQLVLAQYTPRSQPPPAPTSPDLSLAITPLAFPTILPPFGIAIALTLMIVSTKLGLSAGLVIALLVVVMGLNLVSMLLAKPIFKFIRPVTLKILGFTLGVMQFALGIQFILSGLEIQALVIKILLESL